MARANRHCIPGCVWHSTHRCHKKEFLLRFARDRQRWLQWLFEGKKRFGTCILNYAVTSNHIHLLVRDGREQEVSYNRNFAGENSGLRPENSYFWNLSILISTTLLGPTPRRTAQTRRELPPILPASHSLAPGPRQRGSQK
jgi:REP element-mobilizing transposase RayT